MTISTAAGQNTGLLYDGLDWTFETIQHCYDAIKRIAVDELGLDTYPNRIEVITAEQMLDVYTSSGMPLIYNASSATRAPTSAG